RKERRVGPPMTQLLALRKEVSKKLGGISLRQLRNRVRDVSSNEVIPDRTLALLLIATRDAKIDIKQPRFKVPPEKIIALEEFLAKGRATIAVSPTPSQRKVSKDQSVKYRRLLKFTGSYPLPVFYDRLEAEINTAHSNPDLPERGSCPIKEAHREPCLQPASVSFQGS